MLTRLPLLVQGVERCRSEARLLLVTVALLLILIACAPSEGRVSLRVTWDPAPEETLWLRARVERRPDPLLAGSILASAEPVLHAPGQPSDLPITRVPHGDGLVVVVEARREPGLSARALYYGVSELFSLASGQEEVVDVPMVLRPPAGERHPATLSLLFAGQARERVNAEEIGAATVRLELSGTARVVLANDAAFDAGLNTFELDAADARIKCEDQPAGDDPGRRRCDVEGWDLTAGLSAEEGVYAVYARLIDAAGYESAALRASVRLDLTSPDLLTAAALSRVDGFGPAQIAPDAVWAPPDAELRVSFAVTEPLRAPPVILLGDEEIPLPAVEGDEARTVFEHVVRAPAGPEEVAVRANLKDLAGNSARVDLGLVRIDGAAPAAIDEAAQAGIRLFRAPWGAAETDGQVMTELRACPAPEGVDWAWCDGVAPAFEAGARVTVRRAELQAEGAWSCTDEALVVAPVDPQTGGLRLALPGDRAMVCVQAGDPAGNQAEARLVERVEWVISYGGKVPGQTIDNPSVAIAAAHLTPPRDPGDGAAELDYEDARALAEADGEAVRVQASGAWRYADWEARPYTYTPTLAPSAAYAPTSDQVACFGGISPMGFGDPVLMTWDVAREEWAEAFAGSATTEEGHPDSRAFGAMVFDPRRERFLLFGGGRTYFEGAGEWVLDPVGDTWEWGGEVWELVAAEDPAGEAAPSARLGHAMALDPWRGRLILFGGFDGAARLGDTWEWDGGARAWRRLELPGPTPPARDAHVMVTDPWRRRIFLLGGCADGPCEEPLTDVWEWDGEAGRWRDRTPSGSGPSPRIGQGLSYDPVGHGLLVFGGARCLRSQDYRTTQCAERRRDVWSLDPDADAWQALGDLPVELAGRALPTMVSLTPYGLEWLTGGVQSLHASHLARGDVWTGHRDAEWRLRGPELEPPGPSVSELSSLAFDPISEAVWAHGGRAEGAGFTPDTWTWDGRGWTWAASDEDGPGARGFHAMTYSDLDHRVYLFGGTSLTSSPTYGLLFGPLFDDLWAWDRLAGAWSELDHDGARPPARFGHAMIADPVSGDLLVFGGYPAEGAAPLDDLWRWDTQGGGWSQVERAGAWPPARAFGAFASDPDRAQALLVGGYAAWYASPEHEHAAPEDVLQDAWRWDGVHQAWQALDARAEPPLMNAPGLAYDPRRGRFVLFGATRELAAPLSRLRTWEWRDADEAWAERTPARTPPEHGVGRAAVFVPGIDHPGFGADAVVLAPDLRWRWHAHDVQPGLIWRIPLSASGMGTQARLEALTLSALAGARGAEEGAEGLSHDQVRFLLWRPAAGRWGERVALDASPEAPGPLSWTADPSREGLLTTGLDDTLTVALTPGMASGGGDEPATLSVDYLELRLLRRDGRCLPDCDGRACGPDGCGGSCGACPLQDDCVSGVCCLPDCDGRACGGDGCGGSCGACACGESCVDGACAFTACAARACGPDGCGGSCGACPSSQVCDGLGCAPSCDGLLFPIKGCCDGPTLVWCDETLGALLSEPCAPAAGCGWLKIGEDGQYACDTDGGVDPWGFTPKACPEACEPDCEGLVCGWDGCYGDCGACPEGAECLDGECVGCACDPSWQCGMDACGQPCGEPCPVGSICTAEHACVEVIGGGCGDPIALACGDEVVAATTWGPNAILEYPACEYAVFPGREAAFVFTSEETAEVEVTVVPADPWSTWLWIFAVEGACDGEGCLAGLDVFMEGTMSGEALTFMAEAGVPYHLIVDNEIGFEYTEVFTLTVSCVK
jgi:hypothetical protein